jgi:hypothetical protein
VFNHTVTEVVGVFVRFRAPLQRIAIEFLARDSEPVYQTAQPFE